MSYERQLTVATERGGGICKQIESVREFKEIPAEIGVELDLKTIVQLDLESPNLGVYLCDDCRREIGIHICRNCFSEAAVAKSADETSSTAAGY